MKTRWGLSVDPVEKSALTSSANGCSNVTVTVTTVLGGGGPTPPSTTRPPTTTPSSTCRGTNATDVPVPDAGAAVTSAVTIAGCSRAASSTSTVEVHIVHTYRVTS